MALQLKYTPRSTTYEFANAYLKVNFIEVKDGLLLFAAEIFPNETIRDQNRCLLETYVNMAPDDPNDADKERVIYNWIKTQPGFEDAIDV